MFNRWKNLTGINYTTSSDVQKIKVVLRIYDRIGISSELSGSTLDIETGCKKYDKTYDETIVFKYLWSLNGVYGDSYNPLNPLTGYTNGYVESLVQPSPDHNLLSTIIGTNTTKRLPRFSKFTKISNSTYDRKTKSGMTEFRDGVFTIVPVFSGKSYNLNAIREWYRRKRIGSMFCGGVTNYSFVDNWLHGTLYFFKFNKKVRWHNESTFRINRRTTRYPRELIFFNPLEKEFYYRCTPYDASTSTFIGQKYKTIESGFYHEILHPTTFYDVGVRDEFFNDICTDSRLDPASSVIRDITPTSYQEPANIIEHAINYRMDISAGKTDVSDFFTGAQYGNRIKSLDGDIRQLISINSEAGIEAFDLDSPEYFMLNGDLMDPEIENIKSYFHNGSQYGPTPIDFKLDDNGKFIRRSLNYILGDYSQKVPFYLWDKGGIGFGPYNENSDKQKWDRSVIASMKIQRIFSINNYISTETNYIKTDGDEKYLLMPMTINHPTYTFNGNYEDTLERFTEITGYPPNSNRYNEQDLWLYVVSGTTDDPLIGIIYVFVNNMWIQQNSLYIKGEQETFLFQTIQNYYGEKQILSTPFHFYFGLRPQKTALDLLIKYYGPKGAFKEQDNEILDDNNVILPTSVIITTPTPTPSRTSGLSCNYDLFVEKIINEQDIVPDPTSFPTSFPTSTPITTPGVTPTPVIYAYPFYGYCANPSIPLPTSQDKKCVYDSGLNGTVYVTKDGDWYTSTNLATRAPAGLYCFTKGTDGYPTYSDSTFSYIF